MHMLKVETSGQQTFDAPYSTDNSQAVKTACAPFLKSPVVLTFHFNWSAYYFNTFPNLTVDIFYILYLYSWYIFFS